LLTESDARRCGSKILKTARMVIANARFENEYV
jgi:hypothetical protein